MSVVLVFHPMESSPLRVQVNIIDDGLTGPNEDFAVYLCHSHHPLNNVCIQTKVTVLNDDCKEHRRHESFLK